MTKPDAIRRRRSDRLFMQALAVVLALLALSPFFWLLVMSFKTNAEIFRFPPRLFFPVTFDNYAALRETDFRTSFANSLVVSITSTAVSPWLSVSGLQTVGKDGEEKHVS